MIGGVAALLVAEAALVVAVLVSPSATSSLQDRVGALERVWSGSKGKAGLAERIGSGVRSAVSGWVADLRGDAASARTVARKASGAFDGCTSCHPAYAGTRRFSATYMDHPLHAQVGVACATCHTDVEHPNPALPEESVCTACHKDAVTGTGTCQKCHPPGSLPHFYALGYPRDGAVDCSTCHPKGAFASHAASPKVAAHAMTGADKGVCLSCHKQATCDNCHATKHPPDWVQAHGAVAVEGSGGCERCHTTRWCADRCHSVTPSRPATPAVLPADTTQGGNEQW